MATTLLQSVQTVCRKVGLDPTITAFSNTDETLDLVSDIQEAYDELLDTLPPEAVYLFSSGSVVTAVGVRTYSLASDVKTSDLYDWSFQDASQSNQKISPCSREYVLSLDPNWQTTPGKPYLVYDEGPSSIAFYPVPNVIDTITYQYGKSVLTRLSDPADTFIVPDSWVRFITKRAQGLYERRKGFGEADNTDSVAGMMLSNIIVEAWEDAQTYLVEEGFSFNGYYNP